MSKHSQVLFAFGNDGSQHTMRFFASNLSSFSFDAILKFNEESEPYFHFETFQFYSKEASYSVPKSLLKRNFQEIFCTPAI